VTTEALRRIGELYAIEAKIRGKPPDLRREILQAEARPLLNALQTWLRTTMETLSKKSDTTAAILYALNRWEALMRYCEDGLIEIDITRLSGPCAQWLWGARITCLPAPIPAENVQLQCTA
jgi:transposase